MENDFFNGENIKLEGNYLIMYGYNKVIIALLKYKF